MSDEAAFLAALKANPADDTARLVYADWLDEHNEPQKAEYLRFVSELSRFSEVDTSSAEFARAWELGGTLPPEWQTAAGPTFDLLLRASVDKIADKIAAIKEIRNRFFLSLGDSKLVTESPGVAFLLDQPLAAVGAELSALAAHLPLLVQPSGHSCRQLPRFLFKPVLAPWPLSLTDRNEDIEELAGIVGSILGPSAADQVRSRRPENTPVAFDTPLPLSVIGRLGARLRTRLSPPHAWYRHVQIVRC